MIHVTCAIILNEKREVFVAQRSSKMHLPLKWEFPGGKLENGELLEDCLKREIREECDMAIEIVKQLPPNEHQYTDKTIKLIPFLCSWMGGEIYLKEHMGYKWLHPKNLLDLDWAEADIPIVKNYLTLLDGI
ncbi:MAG: (deoxy)nucleoside triphosphate pyrophosphohydrolase [Bacteroidota bacterium]